MKTKSIIGLDLGHSVIKLAEYSPQKKEILTLAKMVLDPEEWKQEADVYKKIAEWIKEKKQASASEIVLGVSAKHAILKQCALPKAEQNIQKAIQWELEQSLISPVEGYFFDYHLSPDSATDELQNFSVAALPKKNIHSILEHFSHHDLPITVVDIDIFAAFNALEANHPEVGSAFLLLKADLNGIGCLAVSRKNWIRYDFIEVPANYSQLQEEEERTSSIEAISNQWGSLLKSIFANEKEEKPTHVFSCGDLLEDEDLMQGIQSAFPLEWSPIQSFQNVSFPHEKEQQEQIAKMAPHCATAVGLSLRFKGDDS